MSAENNNKPSDVLVDIKNLSTYLNTGNEEYLFHEVLRQLVCMNNQAKILFKQYYSCRKKYQQFFELTECVRTVLSSCSKYAYRVTSL